MMIMLRKERIGREVLATKLQSFLKLQTAGKISSNGKMQKQRENGKLQRLSLVLLLQKMAIMQKSDKDLQTGRRQPEPVGGRGPVCE